MVSPQFLISSVVSLAQLVSPSVAHPAQLVSNIVYRHRQKMPFTCFQKVLVPIYDGVNTQSFKKVLNAELCFTFVLMLYILREQGKKRMPATIWP